MLYIYYGKMGDGKTYHVVRSFIVPAIKRGRRIYTNIEGLNAQALAAYCATSPDALDIVQWEKPQEIRDFLTLDEGDKDGASLKIAKGSLIAIDEAQQIWDAREFKSTSKKFLSLCELHRHFGLDLVFITQSPKRMDAALSRLANYFYQVKNLKFLSSYFGHRYVIHVRQSLFDPVVSTTGGKIDPKIFPLYRSAVVHNESETNIKSPLTGGVSLFAVACLVFAVGGLIVRGGFGWMHPDKAIRRNHGNAADSTGPLGAQKGLSVVGADKGAGLGEAAPPAADGAPIRFAPESLHDAVAESAWHVESEGKDAGGREISRRWRWVDCLTHARVVYQGKVDEWTKPGHCKRYEDDPWSKLGYDPEQDRRGDL